MSAAGKQVPSLRTIDIDQPYLFFPDYPICIGWLGPDGPTNMWFHNNLLFRQTTNNGGRGNRSCFFEIGKLIWNCQIAWKHYQPSKEWVKDLCPFSLWSDKIWGFGRFWDGQDLPLLGDRFPIPGKKTTYVLLLSFNILLKKTQGSRGAVLDCKYYFIPPSPPLPSSLCVCSDVLKCVP